MGGCHRGTVPLSLIPRVRQSHRCCVADGSTKSTVQSIFRNAPQTCKGVGMRSETSKRLKGRRKSREVLNVVVVALGRLGWRLISLANPPNPPNPRACLSIPAHRTSSHEPARFGDIPAGALPADDLLDLLDLLSRQNVSRHQPAPIYVAVGGRFRPCGQPILETCRPNGQPPNPPTRSSHCCGYHHQIPS